MRKLWILVLFVILVVPMATASPPGECPDEKILNEFITGTPGAIPIDVATDFNVLFAVVDINIGASHDGWAECNKTCYIQLPHAIGNRHGNGGEAAHGRTRSPYALLIYRYDTMTAQRPLRI